MIVINSSTRQFNIPGADLVFGVTADAGSVVKEFQCPRYVGNNLDLAGSFIRMNYRNANGEVDSYLVSDVTVDGDNVVFGWELTPKVTMYKGNVSFVMCVVGPDTKVKWHTTLGRGQVLEGLEPETDLAEEATADVVAQLIAMVEAQTAAVAAEGSKQIKAVQAAAQTAQSDAVAQIEAKGASTLATIPGEYTATVNAVQSAANAIRKKVSGEVIRVDDVSPMEHYPAVKVSGKNQFNVAAIPVQSVPSSVAYPYVSEVGDGYFCITTREGYTNNGYCELHKTLRELCPGLEVGKKYRLSAKTESSQEVFYLLGTREQWNFGWTKTITEKMLDGGVVAYGFHYTNEGKVGTCRISNIQLEEGTVATDYTPYIDPTTVTVRRCGKNLIPLTKFTTTPSSTTATVASNVLTVAGYLASCRVYGATLIGKKLTISCDSTRSGEKGGGLAIEFRDITNSRLSGIYKQNELSPCFSFTVPNNTNEIVVFFYASGNAEEKGSAEYKNVLLEIGDTETNYEPYIGETLIPAAAGTVSGLRAVSHTMTLLTDTAGVNIECEYSRDTNAVIAELLEKITALGG